MANFFLDYHTAGRLSRRAATIFVTFFRCVFDRGYDTMQKKPQRRSAVPGRSLYEKNAQTQRYGPAAEGDLHKQPTVFAVYVALRLIVLAELVMSIIRGEYESAFICLLVLALFILPFFIQQNFGIQLPSVLEIIILLFIFAAEILGELECYFITYPNWDSMLHTTTGFLCAATGFALSTS